LPEEIPSINALLIGTAYFPFSDCLNTLIHSLGAAMKPVQYPDIAEPINVAMNLTD
jgi:hypothetical protein